MSTIPKKRSLLPFQPNHVSQNWNPNAYSWDSSRFIAKQVAKSDRVLVVPMSEEEDDKGLRLMLGGNDSAEPVSRPEKKIRYDSQVGVNYPMCQVDDCNQNLLNAKEYHRRHKVCEPHSKASNALVAKQMQRFCQQCSRFHPLSAFDEDKRSCKRRLAGHNSRRRKKTKSEDTTTVLQTHENIVNLQTSLASSQGTEKRMTNLSAVPDKEQLMQVLTRLNSSPLQVNAIEKLPIIGSSDKNISKAQSSMNGNSSTPSTKNFLAMLSTNPHEIQSQKIDSEKSNDQFTLPNIFRDRSSLNNQTPLQEIHQNKPLQLYSTSPEINSIPKLAPEKKYFSSGSSNPSVDNRSPSDSPPVTQKMFPIPTSREIRNPSTLQLFGTENGSSQSSIYQTGYTSSSSGSDHSPSSLNSVAQDRTGRISLKLFDKDPSQLPGTLGAEILNWLSNSPSGMEGYIRPGCIFLSIFISMSSSAWDHLENNLYHHVQSLGNDTFYSDFWRNTRFLIQTHKQFASHKEGKVRISRSRRICGSPELISVSPIAIVFGQEIVVSLKGRNLTLPGTNISCTHTSSYTMHQVSGPTYDEISLFKFKINGGQDSFTLGRCFIEVENGVRGTSFPVIIANNTSICQELNLLESEIQESKDETLHFLNELGWLFQRKYNPENSDYKLTRFKFLFIYSIEHDFCVLVKTLLDILLEMNISNKELVNESLKILSEIHLLNIAVKRRSTNMINLLLHYSDNNKTYFFPPNLVGPGGITPLHLAASMSNSDDVINALTNDPQQIGLHSWNTLLDSNGLTPYAYASMRNNDSYNKLVAQKLADKENGQISLSIRSLDLEKDESKRENKGKNSCSKCRIVAAKYSRKRSVRVPGSQGVLQRTYIHSVLAVAAVCVCVCLLLRGAPDIGSIAPFMWRNLEYGSL